MKKENIRIVYMGTTEFSAGILESLINEGWNIIGLVCQADKPVGRKRELEYPATKKVAMAHNIEVFQPLNIREDNEWIKEKNPDLIITCAYGQIVPKAVLSVPRLKCINVHGSLLPELRGAAPIQYAILNDLKVTGITIMEMVKKMDAGQMFAKRKVVVDNEDTSDSLFKKMEIVASSLLLEMLPDYIEGRIDGVEQDESLVTFAPSIKREEEIIDWNDTKRNIYNKIRAFNSVPGAYSVLDGVSIKIWSSEEVNKNYDGVNGEIVEVLKDKFIVKVSDGAIAIKELQVAGKKKMLARDFLNGNKELKGRYFMAKIDFNNKIINDAVSILKDDGVIVVPTDTVYGLACSGNSEAGLNKIYSIKKRSFSKKLPIIVDSYERLLSMFEVSEDSLRKLKPFFPGQLTLILKKKNSEETVAVRMINNEIINKIIEGLDCYLYLTSANKSNEEPISDISDLIDEFDGKVDMIVMGSKMKGVNSTIVDLTGSELRLVREGSILFSQILEIYSRG